MIKIRKQHPYKVPHFDPKGNHIGDLDVYQAIDLELQLVDLNLAGYYAEFEGTKLIMTPTSLDTSYTPFSPYECIVNRIEQRYQ